MRFERDMNGHGIVPRFDLTRTAARGSGAGILATTTMTAAMLTLQKTGLLGRMPPHLLTERTLARLGLRRKSSRRSRRVLTVANHYAFGASMGALFEVARSAIGTRRGRPARASTLVAAGVAFGTLVWAASYAGWIPAAGLMPRPSRDRPGRPTSMVLAHGIFGGTLATALAIRDALRS